MNQISTVAPFEAPILQPRLMTAAQRQAEEAAMEQKIQELEAKRLVAETAEIFFPGLLKDRPQEAFEEAARLILKLEPLNRRFAIALIEGRTVVLDMYSVQPPRADSLNSAVVDATLPRAFPTALEFRALTNLHMATQVRVHKKTEGEMNIADAWLHWPGHRKYARGIVFSPGVAQEDLPGDRLNLFTGWGIPPQDPDHKADVEACSLFLHHLRFVICGGDEAVYQWLLWWCADILQNPRSKPGSAVVLAGKKGSGKSFVADVLREIIGPKYFVRVSKKKDLVGEFNAHFAAALLVNCEEATFGGDIEANNTLKDMITSEYTIVNEKFMPRQNMRSYSRFIFTTNSDYSHSTSEDERRFLFLDVGSQFCGDTAYFDRMAGQLDRGGYQALANLLHSMKRPDGVNLRKPPRTEAHTRLFAESLSIEERFFYNAAVTGEGFPEAAEAEGGIVFVSDVKAAFDAYIDDHAKGRSFKRSDNNFVPACMQKFWGVDPESWNRKTRNRRKEVCYEVPSLRNAREWLAMPTTDGGLGLSRHAVGLDEGEEG